MSAVEHYTPPANSSPPYWRCHDVYGAPGETVCWMCPNTAPEADGPSLHTSTGEVLDGEADLAADLPDTPTLLERSTE